MTNIVQAAPLGNSSRAAALQKAIGANMTLLPFVNVINPNGIPGGGAISGATADGIDFKRFSLANAQLLITTNWNDPSMVELRCFSVAQGSLMFGNRYAVKDGEDALLDVADKFCDDFLEAVIGRGDFFRSSMAFIKTDGARKRDVWSVRPNGRYLHRLTNMQGEALSPSWSPDGRKVIFTHIDKRSHGLGIYDTGSKSTQRIKFPGNTVIGPTYLPDGRVAVSLTDGRNPSIFILGHSLEKQGKLDESQSIDVSPSVDAKGTLMAFTSNRMGGPQIFLKDLRSGSVRRISQYGNYNTDPSISPDGTLIAYARQEGGGHRIYVQDLISGQERQLTFGPGSDEEPAFAPDSYFIAFMSTRNGKKSIYITTRNGGEPKLLPSGAGDAAFPAWSRSMRARE
jgi:TolB protein